MRKVLVGAVALALTLAACSAETNPPTNVTGSSATLNASYSFDAGDGPGEYWFEARLTGPDVGSPAAFTEVAGSRASFPDLGSSGGPSPHSYTWNGVAPGTYQYRFCGYGDKDALTTTVCFDANGTGHTTPTPELVFDSFTVGFQPGVVANADLAKAARVADHVNAPHVRVEFGIGQAANSTMDNVIADFADDNVRVLLLAGFAGRIPTVAEAQNLASWTNRYGPGGSFWAGRSDGHLAVRQIEFGNETSFCYQYDCQASYENTTAYCQRAKDYASRAKSAVDAINATGKQVGVLVQADHGGSGSDNWVECMFAQVANLDDLAGGWSVHPYGPQTNWNDKLSKVVAHTNTFGGGNNLPIDITEYGLSSRDGLAVSNNYGWPTNQTYAQAGSALTSTVSGIRAASYGPRIRDFMVYATYDLQPVSAGTDREWYFGIVKSDETDKGAYTTAVRSLLGG